MVDADFPFILMVCIVTVDHPVGKGLSDCLLFSAPVGPGIMFSERRMAEETCARNGLESAKVDRPFLSPFSFRAWNGWQPLTHGGEGGQKEVKQARSISTSHHIPRCESTTKPPPYSWSCVY